MIFRKHNTDKDILHEIVENKRAEVDMFKRFLPPRQLYTTVEADMAAREGKATVSMKDELMKSQNGIIAEFKRKSPSKGWINKTARPDVVPLQYQENGAAAISILTDTKYFGGYDEYIMYARESGVTIPILYKNFIIDEYQLFQAYHAGASAVLLIAACLDKQEYVRLQKMAHNLNLEVLLEMHNEHDFEYAEAEPDMYGINNRNLGTFVTDVENSFRLAERLPADVCKVSESGISDADTIKKLRKAGFNGFLIGEQFMKSDNPGQELGDFAKACKSEG